MGTYPQLLRIKCVYFLGSILDTKSTRGFADRGYITKTKDANGTQRTQLVRRINGVSNRVYKLNININKSSGDNPTDNAGGNSSDKQDKE